MTNTYKRHFKHFEKAVKEKIVEQSSSEEHRESLSIPFLAWEHNYQQTRWKRAVVVLRNASNANKHEADKSILNATKIIYETFVDVGEIVVLNLFSLKTRNAKEIEKKYIEYGKSKEKIGMVGECKINTNIVNETLKGSNYCICAWGNETNMNKEIFNEAIDNFWNLYSNLKIKPSCFRKTQKGNDKFPHHASLWTKTDRFIRINK